MIMNNISCVLYGNYMSNYLWEKCHEMHTFKIFFANSTQIPSANMANLLQQNSTCSPFLRSNNEKFFVICQNILKCTHSCRFLLLVTIFNFIYCSSVQVLCHSFYFSSQVHEIWYMSVSCRKRAGWRPAGWSVKRWTFVVLKGWHLLNVITSFGFLKRVIILLLMQWSCGFCKKRYNSITNAMELSLFCTNHTHTLHNMLQLWNIAIILRQVIDIWVFSLNIIFVLILWWDMPSKMSAVITEFV